MKNLQINDYTLKKQNKKLTHMLLFWTIIGALFTAKEITLRDMKVIMDHLF